MRIVQTGIVVLILLAMADSMISGVILSRHVLSFLPIKGGRSFARNLYMVSVYWGFVLMAVQIDIAEVTKLTDMAEKEMTDELRERYAALLVTGEDCVHCGSCTRRCPFGIDASENMRRAQRAFGC